MARYLTPGRIGTLLLIELYRKQDFWTHAAETSTTILRMIAQQCLQPANEDGVTSSWNHADQVSDVLAFAKPLTSLDAELPGRPWSSILLQKVWNLKSVDELHDLLDSCSGLLASSSLTDSQPDVIQANAITRASQIGQFIRRCHVQFTRLQFAEVLTLWKSFLAWREPSRSIWAQQYPEAARKLSRLEAEDSFMIHRDARPYLTDAGIVSSDDVEAVLTASVAQLQKLGQRVPGDVKARIEQWLAYQQSHSLLSLRNFMAFFDAWRAGEYNTAVENLHRYFDYALSKGDGEEMKTQYQYALLHLSVLHADFDHWEESVNAMRECIATARENQDATCLNFALSWLMYLRQSRHTRLNAGHDALAAFAGERGSEQEELEFLKMKAREGKHWTLMSSTLLEEAKFEMRHHGVCAKSLELIIQSSYLNVQHGLHSLVPATTIFEAASFDRLGQSHLSQKLHSSLLSNSTTISLGDRARVVCRLAYDSAQRGRYDHSIAMLQDLKSRVRGTLKLEQKVIASAEVVGLMRAVRRSDLQAAEYHMANLRAARENADPDLAMSIDHLELLLLAKQNRLDVAFEKLATQLDLVGVSDDDDIAHTTSMLIQKANIFAATGHALKGFSITLRAVASAQQHSLLGLLVEALEMLCRILNELGEYTAARDLAQAALPYAFEMSNTAITGQLFVSLGEAFVGLAAKQDAMSRNKYLQLLRTASAYIDRGREEFAKIQEYSGQLDCLLMKARLAKCTGDDATVEHANGMYEQVMAQHEELLRRS